MNTYATANWLRKNMYAARKQRDALLEAAHDVLDKWESGDLALAVRELAAIVAETEEAKRKESP